MLLLLVVIVLFLSRTGLCQSWWSFVPCILLACQVDYCRCCCVYKCDVFHSFKPNELPCVLRKVTVFSWANLDQFRVLLLCFTGLLPRGIDTPIKSLAKYKPKDSWNRKRALKGQNDFIGRSDHFALLQSDSAVGYF